MHPTFLWMAALLCTVVCTDITGPNWRCPSLSIKSVNSKISCSCEIPHTLRCDGAIESDEKQVIGSLLNQVKYLAPQESITLLDISIQNITRLPGRIFQNVSIAGLVVSSGRLENVHSKAFLGLEKQLTALALPENDMTSIPSIPPNN